MQVLSAEGAGLRTLGESPATVGLVLVSPTILKRRQLDGLADLRSMTGWQLLGVITYRRRGHGSAQFTPSAAGGTADEMGESALAMAPAGAKDSATDAEGSSAQTIVLDQPAAPAEDTPVMGQASDGLQDPDGSREWAPSRWK